MSIGRLVVIGGGTGFIGQHLENLLKNKGYAVKIITRTPKKKNHFSWTDLETLGLPRETHAVVNLSGQNILDWRHRWTAEFKQLVWDSRVKTTKTLVDAICQADGQVDSLTTISGVGIYKDDNRTHSEKDHVKDFDFLSKMCIELETVCQVPAEHHCRNLIVRSGVVLGREGGMIKQLYWPFACGLGGPMGSGHQILPWIHVADLTLLMFTLLDTPQVCGVFNGVAPTETTNKEFAQALGKALHRPAFIPMPEFVLNAMFQDRAVMITSGPRVKPERTLEFGYKFVFGDIFEACQHICHPVLDPGLFLEWCRKDTCNNHPELACSAITSYAKECLSTGFCVDWHSDLCPPQECPPGLSYQVCGTSCPNTCDSKSPCKTDTPTSGCFCPDGLYLLNETCVEKQKCTTCDEEGHHAGEKWTKDACTQCECLNSTMKCQTIECHDFETICETNYVAMKVPKDADQCCDRYVCIPGEISVSSTCPPPQKLECGPGQNMKLEIRPSDGCQQFVCHCKPVEECPVLEDVENSNETLPDGMKKVIKDGGCCKVMDLVCDVSLCDPPPLCEEFHTLFKEPKKDQQCCPEYKCLKPDKCIVVLEYTTGEEGGERLRNVYEHQKVLKEANDTWNDGPCRKCKCYGSPGLLYHSLCTLEECPLLSSLEDHKDYELSTQLIKGQCCPKISRKGCKYLDNVYKPGEKWVDPMDPCKKIECKENGEQQGLEKQMQTISCDESCELGYEYMKPDSKECCGSCKPTGCVVNGLVKKVGDEWTSQDYCTNYFCLSNNGTMQVQSVMVVCAEIPDEQFEEYVFEFNALPGQCCKNHKMIACKVDDKMFLPGQSWPAPDGNLCKSYSCVNVEGLLAKQETIKTCDEKCPFGWSYKDSRTECCGECIQDHCIVDGTLKEPGTNWTSKDNCTVYACEKQSDQFTINSYQVSCPLIEDCPAENVYVKDCCRYCNRTNAESMSNCLPVEIPRNNSKKLVSEVKNGHGLCSNLDLVQNFTECVGSCHSATFYNKDVGAHESVCSCCRASKYRLISVQLTCQDGYKFYKQLSVPEKCSCEGCTSLKNPLTYGLN